MEENMEWHKNLFTNIGAKIKKMTEVSFWTGAAVCVIYGILLLSVGYLEGFSWVLFGPGLAWLGCLALYGFGELIEKVSYIEQKLNGKPIERCVSEKRKETSDAKRELEMLLNRGYISVEQFLTAMEEKTNDEKNT